MDLRKFFIGRTIGLVILLCIAALVAGFYALNNFIYKEKQGDATIKYQNTQSDIYVSYKNSEYSPEFSYPKSWGEITIKEGNKACPEEDTYRTSDTLNIFDWEFSFPDTKLPNSDSFIRTGIRTYELDPKKINNCGDDFFLKIAKKEILPEALSSVRLNSITNKNGLWGIYNPQASRLDTEMRTQYTFFIKSKTFDIIYIIQPYASFIPYFGSPELIEIENQFTRDISKYIDEGKTAGNIRKHFEEFRNMSESLKFAAE